VSSRRGDEPAAAVHGILPIQGAQFGLEVGQVGLQIQQQPMVQRLETSVDGRHRWTPETTDQFGREEFVATHGSLVAAVVWLEHAGTHMLRRAVWHCGRPVCHWRRPKRGRERLHRLAIGSRRCQRLPKGRETRPVFMRWRVRWMRRKRWQTVAASVKDRRRRSAFGPWRLVSQHFESAILGFEGRSRYSRRRVGD